MSPPLALGLYAAATGLIEPLAPLLLQGRARRGKEDSDRLDERLGRTDTARPPGRLAWLHGASVGESLSLLPLVETIAAARPQVTILMTSGTRTSAELLARRLPCEAIHQYAPLDAPGSARRFVDHWRPDLGLFVESDLWPNLLRAARSSGARLALLSARMSPASLRGWRRAPHSAQALLGLFDLILAKDAAAAAAFRSLGAEVAGLADLKFGAADLPVDPLGLAQARAQLGARSVILAASTHPGDEARVLDAFQAVGDRAAEALLIIVPRHPERGPAIAALVQARGLEVGLRSAGEQPGAAQVYVADTLGELGLWYRLARLAILGGAFAPGVGGHNPLEPARLSCPFVCGPHVQAWAQTYADLWRIGGDGPVEIASALAERIDGALLSHKQPNPTVARLSAYVETRDAETRKVADRVLGLLP